MPKKRNNEDVLGLRGLLPYREFITAMDTKHKIPPAELGRGLFAAAAEFYRVHGWFSFPVRIEPEAFQARYVAEHQAPFTVAAKTGAPAGGQIDGGTGGGESPSMSAANAHLKAREPKAKTRAKKAGGTSKA